MIRNVCAEAGIDLDRGPHGDPWGTSMSLHFACADALFAADEAIPWDWQYRPGLGAGTLDPDEDYEAIELTTLVAAGRLTWDNVRHIGNVLHRYERVLERAGRAY